MSDAGKSPERGAEYRSFLDHLIEMRSRLILVAVIVAVTTGLSWAFFGWINDQIVLAPLRRVSEEMGSRDVAIYPPITLALHEAFVYVMKMGLLAGLVFSSPIILYEIWAFVSPGLMPSERSALVPIFWLGLVFFLGGMAVCYFWVLPTAIRYMVVLTDWTGAKLTLRLKDYSGFFLGLEFAFGATFEMPLVMMALARTRIVSPGAMIARWRYMIVGAFVAGAVLTPPDPGSQIMMAICMISLYGLGILFARMVYPRGEKKD